MPNTAYSNNSAKNIYGIFLETVLTGGLYVRECIKITFGSQSDWYIYFTSYERFCLRDYVFVYIRGKLKKMRRAPQVIFLEEAYIDLWEG